jgi:hypothetical protein
MQLVGIAIGKDRVNQFRSRGSKMKGCVKQIFDRTMIVLLVYLGQMAVIHHVMLRMLMGMQLQ